ncbi:hypothetical protein [Pseudomonas tohonis]|uniref:hypothetical protein n=1 Tax=Pseudomonas tohonis TaxID=2725477 RepID=UPI0022EFFED6|nr:hypothetical protein [Pseudomonas tohonis]
MAWHGIEEMAEALQLAILNLHALGPEGSAHAFAVPRHEITISENVAQMLGAAGAKEAACMDESDA